MKRITILILALIVAFSISACGGSDGGSDDSESQSEETKVSSEPQEYGMKHEGQEPVGTGTIYLVNESGTTENDNVLYVMYEEESRLEQFGLEAWDFDGTRPTVIYVDGEENTKEQLADTQTSINLQGDDFGKGVHNVEAVQYADNEKDIVFYKLMQYEVK